MIVFMFVVSAAPMSHSEMLKEKARASSRLALAYVNYQLVAYAQL